MDEFKLVASVVSALLWSAWLVALLGANGVRPLRGPLGGLSRLGWLRGPAVLFLVVRLTLFAGAKHETNRVCAVTKADCVTETSGMADGTGVAIRAAPRALRAVAPTAMRLAGSALADGMTAHAGEANAFRGYRRESVSASDAVSYAMPDGASVRGTWHLTGAYEDVCKVGLDGFVFPLGANLCTSLWAYAWGKVRPQLRNATNEIAAVRAPMSAIPGVSRFWTAATSNDTYLLTWENFALGRIAAPASASSHIPDPPSLVSAQIELMRNGDFIARSNEVESVWRRVIEPNPDPLHPYGPVQDLSVIEEPNAYCWVDIVVQADAGDNVTDYDTFGGERELAAGAENVYTCPAAGTDPVVTLRCAGVDYRPAMTVVEPQSVEALSVTSEGTFSPGDVCMGVMVSRVYVKPFAVSFSGVQIYEAPCTNAIPPTGYFATTSYTGPLTHVYPNAGFLHIPDEDNYVMTDRAGRTDPYPNWSAGTLTWKVPIGWRRMRGGDERLFQTRDIDYAIYDNYKSRPLLIGGREDAYTQTFEIESNGTSSIRKFGYKLERNRWLPFGTVSQTGEN